MQKKILLIMFAALITCKTESPPDGGEQLLATYLIKSSEAVIIIDYNANRGLLNYAIANSVGKLQPFSSSEHVPVMINSNGSFQISTALDGTIINQNKNFNENMKDGIIITSDYFLINSLDGCNLLKFQEKTFQRINCSLF
ncbi:hypothetical protein [Leptospira stimsonii]|uniref:Lipoprotein n=1 Tax=Leptospira stimsonii TaxID=2202203 RepID=A0ABY2N9E4_9LEPT|nr:hypothetical protein [Leptospira stimsonii]TGK18864.1 hypothetical protein EHO98_12205 [Leptospira stimsonii]TGM18977.1 hypothetical protein EHQ90_05495 [Leptospira stimsonii]